jgi:hypothetical protein
MADGWDMEVTTILSDAQFTEAAGGMPAEIRAHLLTTMAQDVASLGGVIVAGPHKLMPLKGVFGWRVGFSAQVAVAQ